MSYYIAVGTSSMGIKEKLAREMGRDPTEEEVLRAKLAKITNTGALSWMLQLVDHVRSGNVEKLVKRNGLSTRRPIKISFTGSKVDTTFDEIKSTVQRTLAVDQANGLKLFVGDADGLNDHHDPVGTY